MSCYFCLSFNEKKSSGRSKTTSNSKSTKRRGRFPIAPTDQPQPWPESTKGMEKNNIVAETFTFRELATATNNFRQECLIGEGGFGRVYKGKIGKNSQDVAVKQLDRNGMQGNKEFLVEVLMLSLLHHENLVNLIGYCADGDQRLLVYEYLPLGSLEDHLFEIDDNETEKKPLDWKRRMKIALGAAKGIEYLHDKANPPVIYRDLKSSNILLDNDFNPKLSDFGLAKIGPVGEKTHVSSRVMGTYGYCAPEYQRTGQLTVKSDVYSFGVVLLELITGRRAIDTSLPNDEQHLVTWAQPVFKDQNKLTKLADPILKGEFPVKALNQAVAIAAMCLHEEPSVRPLISDVMTALGFLMTGQDLETDKRLDNIFSLPLARNTIMNSTNGNNLDEETGQERERDLAAEAIEWGSTPRWGSGSSF